MEKTSQNLINRELSGSKDTKLEKGPTPLMRKATDTSTSPSGSTEPKAIPTKTLYSWKAPTRVFQRRDRSWFLKIAIVVLFIIIFLALVKQLLLIGVVLALMFVVYVLATVPPDVVEHKITNKGVESYDRLYKWDELKSFWISRKGRNEIVNIEMKIRFPRRLIILVGQGRREEITKYLGEKLPYREDVSQTWLGRVSDGEYQEYHEERGVKG